MGSVLMKPSSADGSMDQQAFDHVFKDYVYGLQQLSELYDLKKIIFKGSTNLLHVAASAGSKKCVKYLLDVGLDPNSVDISNETPLHSCILAQKHSIECLELILKHKADINAKNVWFRTPLMKAIVNFKYSCAKYLIREGADVNTYDKYGTTPLHVCASYGNFDLMEVLLQHKVFVNAKDVRGRTALNFAILGNHQEIFYKFLSTYCYENSAIDLEQSVQLVITKLEVEMLQALLTAGASVRNPSIDLCLKIVQKCVKGTDANAEKSSEQMQKVYKSIQCMKLFISANGFPVTKSIDDKISNLMNSCTNVTILKYLHDLKEILAVVVETKKGTPDTLQNLSRRKCRCALMLQNKNVIWAANKLDVSQVAVDLCTLKL